jgi:hypothetical protein
LIRFTLFGPDPYPMGCLLFLKYTPSTPSSGPLPWLGTLPGMHFPDLLLLTSSLPLSTQHELIRKASVSTWHHALPCFVLYFMLLITPHYFLNLSVCPSPWQNGGPMKANTSCPEKLSNLCKATQLTGEDSRLQLKDAVFQPVLYP